MGLTNDDKYVIMAFMIERQENKRVKNTLEKSQNYSRMPLTNDDNYIIMANMTNNNNTTFFSKRFTMSISDLCFACVFGVLSAASWAAIAWVHLGM